VLFSRTKKDFRSGRDPDRISVIIPCRNYANFLPDAIESVLCQSYRRFEIIVVDDDSSDRTSEVISRYPNVRYIRTRRKNVSAARNLGFSQSTGGYGVFLDADDRLLPCAFEAGLNALAEHPECPMVFGLYRMINADGSDLNSVQPFVPSVQYRDMLLHNYIGNPGAVMYRTGIFDVVGGFDESLSPAADFELYLRIGRNHRIFAHPKAVVEYRQHPANMSKDATLMLDAIMKVFRAQDAFVSGDPACTDAFQTGMRKYLRLYYYANILELESRLAGHQWLAALSTARVLSRYYRRDLLIGLTRTLCRIVKRDSAAGFAQRKKTSRG
jgi:glycosyltransferase involved in cell wall biosynthesis